MKVSKSFFYKWDNGIRKMIYPAKFLAWNLYLFIIN